MKIYRIRFSYIEMQKKEMVYNIFICVCLIICILIQINISEKVYIPMDKKENTEEFIYILEKLNLITKYVLQKEGATMNIVEGNINKIKEIKQYVYVCEHNKNPININVISRKFF